jgi:hypothetical protein
MSSNSAGNAPSVAFKHTLTELPWPSSIRHLECVGTVRLATAIMRTDTEVWCEKPGRTKTIVGTPGALEI